MSARQRALAARAEAAADEVVFLFAALKGVDHRRRIRQLAQKYRRALQAIRASGGDWRAVARG